MELTPYRVYKTAEHLCRVYSEWMSGDDAWQIQVSLIEFCRDCTNRNKSQLPPGATVLGTILSSDKTNISVLTGDRVAHPLLLSLANIKMSTRLKLSSHAFLLTALLPVPKFIHRKKRMKGVLEDRLIHQCLDIILEPLKRAAAVGVMLSDPWGHLRYCFTPLAAYIVDTPEAAMLATVGGKTSPVTMAMYTEFGDSFQHEPRTSPTTLAQIATASAKADPEDIEVFFREAQKFRLNGVHKPFWRNYPLSCPSRFITPELLHHIHKEFWDHDVQWCINALGSAEIDYRFSVLQPITGFRHFKEGISGLKQVTGRTHRDIQRFIIGVIAGAAPRDVVIAIRALLEFRYRIQAYEISDDNIDLIVSALNEFHSHKRAILEAGLRQGKGGRPISNWHIPKLELMQNIAPSIPRVGVSIQWSADITEHAHIEQIKDPARTSNNNNYDPQICRQLDRLEKCRNFDLAMSLKDPQLHSGTRDDEDEGSDDDGVEALPRVPQPTRLPVDYFTRSIALASSGTILPLPPRTFSVGRVAINMAYDPSIRRISVDDAATLFRIPDLRAGLADFFSHEHARGVDAVHPIGGPRKASNTAALPFEYLQVWFKLRLQTRDFHTNAVLPAQTLLASPPGGDWEFGRYDSVVAITDVSDASHVWPTSGLRGALFGFFDGG